MVDVSVRLLATHGGTKKTLRGYLALQPDLAAAGTRTARPKAGRALWWMGAACSTVRRMGAFKPLFATAPMELAAT